MIRAAEDPTPFGFWQTALFLKKVHRVWQISVRVPTYTNPDNFFGLGVGYALNFVLGQNRLLKLPAVPFLIGTRLLDLFEQEDTFRSSCRSWLGAIKGVQPITLVEQSKGNYHLTRWLKTKRLLIRIQRIASASLKVGKEAFHVTMRIMDILELITFDSARLQELVDLSVKEGALNISRCFKALHRNKEALIRRVQRNQETINRLLKMLGARKTRAEDVVSYTQAAIEKLHDWTSGFEAIGQAVGGFITGQKKPPLITPPRKFTLPINLRYR